jgi:hypothetical protein
MKRYYTTREVSEMLLISKQDVVYWGNKTGVRKVLMVGGGKRRVFRFSENDIEAIKLKLL